MEKGIYISVEEKVIEKLKKIAKERKQTIKVVISELIEHAK